MSALPRFDTKEVCYEAFQVSNIHSLHQSHRPPDAGHSRSGAGYTPPCTAPWLKRQCPPLPPRGSPASRTYCPTVLPECTGLYHPQARPWCCQSSPGVPLLQTPWTCPWLPLHKLRPGLGSQSPPHIPPHPREHHWEAGVWNRNCCLRRFLLLLRHEGGVLETLVPAESESGGSNSRSRQLGAKNFFEEQVIPDSFSSWRLFH